MKLVDYLGLSLKSDEVIDLLEGNALDVIYQFDRLHEGDADSYVVHAYDSGFEMRFDEQQILRTIWCHIQGKAPVSNIAGDVIGVPIFRSTEEARLASGTLGARFTFAENVKLLGTSLNWAKLTFDDRSWHYQFDDAGLTLVTLSTA